jgi:hypothetical protein
MLMSVYTIFKIFEKCTKNNKKKEYLHIVIFQNSKKEFKNHKIINFDILQDFVIYNSIKKLKLIS